jgi:hypothetical protein
MSRPWTGSSRVLVKEGAIEQRGPLDGETDFPELPRLVFHHTRHKYGLIRGLIDRINECEPQQVQGTGTR